MIFHPMEVKQVENELLEGFALWEKSIYDLHRDNVNLKLEKESILQKLERCTEEVDKQATRLKEAEEVANQLQGVVSAGCDMEEENRKLRRDVMNYKAKLLEKEESYMASVASLEKEMEKMKNQLQEELEKTKEELVAKAEEEKESLRNTISEKTKEVQAKENIILEKENEHQTTVMQLRFEYDSELLKLQKQNARNQQAPQPAGSKQDIFRKKLQNMRAEADREQSTLKRRVSELEQELKAYIERQTVQKPGGPPQGHNAKRIRRF